MLNDAINYHPVSGFFIILAIVAGMVMLYRWAGRFKFVPSDDHNPSDHHHWGLLLAFGGFILLIGMIAMGFGNTPIQAEGAPALTAVEEAN